MHLTTHEDLTYGLEWAKTFDNTIFKVVSKVT